MSIFASRDWIASVALTELKQKIIALRINESFRIELTICAVSRVAEPFLQAMSMNLPPIIQKYVDASNAHDVKSVLECFANDAVVRDETATHRGKVAIGHWLTITTEKYKFHSNPPSRQH